YSWPARKNPPDGNTAICMGSIGMGGVSKRTWDSRAPSGPKLSITFVFPKNDMPPLPMETINAAIPPSGRTAKMLPSISLLLNCASITPLSETRNTGPAGGFSVIFPSGFHTLTYERPLSSHAVGSAKVLGPSNVNVVVILPFCRRGFICPGAGAHQATERAMKGSKLFMTAPNYRSPCVWLARVWKCSLATPSQPKYKNVTISDLKFLAFVTWRFDSKPPRPGQLLVILTFHQFGFHLFACRQSAS